MTTYSQFSGIPPQWVLLRDAAKWIEQKLGFTHPKLQEQIILAVRDGLKPRHRINGRWTERGFYTPRGISRGDGSLDQYHVVSSWEIAKADFESCTVKPPTSECLPIEIFWPDLSHWAELHRAFLESRRRREAQQNALEAQAEQPAELQNSVVSILQIDPVRTGAPGRPTGSHLVLAEFEKRMSQGMREQTVKAESELLHEWYLRNHPTLPNLTRGAIENKIRVKFRESAPQK